MTLDFSILQDNSAYNFSNPAAARNWSSGGYVPSYYTMDKSNVNVISYGWNSADFTLPCFRPIFEFNQE